MRKGQEPKGLLARFSLRPPPSALATKSVDDRFRGRPHAAPDEERFRGLLHQHAQPVHRPGAALGRELHEQRLPAVDHLVGQRACREDVARQRRHDVGQAGRGRIDDYIEAQAGERSVWARADAVSREFLEFVKISDQGDRLVQCAVGDHHRLRQLAQQRLHHAKNRATGAHQQQALATDGAIVVAREVARQTRAIGIVAGEAPVLECERVDRACGARAGGVVVGEPPRLLLERQRDVESLAAFFAELEHRSFETVERSEQPAVGNILAGRAREFGVDRGRQAVLDRVADDCVPIGHDVPRRYSSDSGPTSSLRKTARTITGESN